jgi:hypothetical protein
MDYRREPARAARALHPTAARLARRLEERGLQVEVVTLSDSARTADLAASALGHDTDLPTMIDESLRRFSVVWAAAGTPHDVFGVEVGALIDAIPGAQVLPVS